MNLKFSFINFNQEKIFFFKKLEKLNQQVQSEFPNIEFLGILLINDMEASDPK